MAKQYFPSVEELLDILLAEIPSGVYASDRADDPVESKRSYSSAELRAQATVLASLYKNLQMVDANKHITTVTAEGLPNWEKEFFKDAQDSNASFEQRQQTLFAKLRSSGGITLPALQSIVDGILNAAGLTGKIFPWSGQGITTPGAWILDVTPLGDGTYLSIRDPLTGAGQDPGIVPLDCDLNYAAAGITAQDLLDIQATAYTYDVNIYGNANAETLALLDRQLTLFEPARSTHFIRNNAVGPTDAETIVPSVYLADVPWR